MVYSLVTKQLVHENRAQLTVTTCLEEGFGCMLYWNGPNCAPGLAAAPPFVCCLCTSLVLHLGCVSFKRHVNTDCPVQMKLSFLLAWLCQPLLQIPAIPAEAVKPYRPVGADWPGSCKASAGVGHPCKECSIKLKMAPTCHVTHSNLDNTGHLAFTMQLYAD